MLCNIKSSFRKTLLKIECVVAAELLLVRGSTSGSEVREGSHAKAKPRFCTEFANRRMYVEYARLA